MSTEVNTNLNQEEQELVIKSFEEAKDFRTLGERITAPIDSIVDETTKIIENDPIMTVSDELAKMNTKMQVVYANIIDNDGSIMKFLKALPLIGSLAEMIDEKLDEGSFNIKTINEQITGVFSGFDQSYKSLNTSIDMQYNFLDGIDKNLGKVIDYKDFLDIKLEEFTKTLKDTKEDQEKLKLFIRSVEFFQTNLTVLIGNLEMARKRLLIRLDSAKKLSLSMNSSKPIFKTLLSTAVIEISGQKAIDASMTAIRSMSETIDKMSTTLTDEAIASNKKAEELSSKPILSLNVFIDNVTKLKNHFDEIEDYREKIMIDAKKEQEDFDKARKNLEDIKVLTKSQSEELEKILID